MEFIGTGIAVVTTILLWELNKYLWRKTWKTPLKTEVETETETETENTLVCIQLTDKIPLSLKPCKKCLCTPTISRFYYRRWTGNRWSISDDISLECCGIKIESLHDWNTLNAAPLNLKKTDSKEKVDG